MLTIGSQVQLGLKPRFDYYLLLIFFITVIDYTLHRIVKLLFGKSSIVREKYDWAFKNLKSLYITIGLAFIGMVTTLFFIELRVILWLLPLGVIAVFYSLPPKIGKRKIPTLRNIPGLKIFVISITWSGLTILLPLSQMEYRTTFVHVFLMLTERFLFIFALTLAFDIRDMLEDYKSGVRTIPIIYGKQKSQIYSNVALVAALAIGLFHYVQRQDYAITLAVALSLGITLFFMNFKPIKKASVYYHGFLDGTVLLQGILLTLSFYFHF
jgi:4-hydroxybenzoate polyprenyltransferase